MHHLIYMSQAVRPMEEEELAALLVQARQANAQRQITGALLYGGNRFLQVIEGEEQELAALYAHLLADPRHQNVTKLADKKITQRSFTDWSMAFQSVSPEYIGQLEGYFTPDQLNLQAPGLSEIDKLLLAMTKHFMLSPHDLT